MVYNDDKTRVLITGEKMYDVSSNPSKADFKDIMKIKIIDFNEEDKQITFDLIGFNCALVNSFRRILLGEIPTMAFEKFHRAINSTYIKDEIMAHRLSLLPIRADANLFKETNEEELACYDPVTDQGLLPDRHLKFVVDVECTWKPGADKKSDREVSMDNYKVLSGQVKWVPFQGQEATYGDIGLVWDDILLAKMSVGQKLEGTLIAVKGTCKTHSKHQACHAYYKLMPTIKLKRRFFNEEARKLQKCFEKGVIECIKNEDGDEEASVIHQKARDDTCSREVYNQGFTHHDVECGMDRNHFIFSIESENCSKNPDELFCESLKVLMAKCTTLLEFMESINDEEN